MSTMRAIAGNRAPSERDRGGKGLPAVLPPGGPDFPAMLAATGTAETPAPDGRRGLRPSSGGQQGPSEPPSRKRQHVAVEYGADLAAADPARAAAVPDLPAPAVAPPLDAEIGDPYHGPSAVLEAAIPPVAAEPASLGSAMAREAGARLETAASADTPADPIGAPGIVAVAAARPGGGDKSDPVHPRLSPPAINSPENLALVPNVLAAAVPISDHGVAAGAPSTGGDGDALSATAASLASGASARGPVRNGSTPALARAPSAQAAANTLAPDQGADPAPALPIPDTASLGAADIVSSGLERSVGAKPGTAPDAGPRLLDGAPPEPNAAAVVALAVSIPRREDPFRTSGPAGPIVDAAALGGHATSVTSQADGPAEPATAVPLPELAERLSAHLVRLAGNEGAEVVLRLHPPELGDLTLRVAVHGRDVSAWFASPQSHVQLAISDAIGQLRTDLGNAGYNLDSAWIGADPRGASERQERFAAPQRPGAATRQSPDEPLTPPTQSASSRVSVYV